MTWQIALLLSLLAAAIVAFVRERHPPELIALSLLLAVVVTGLVPAQQALAVFSNPAPITVAAMFVLSSALVRCGALDHLRPLIIRAAGLPYPVAVFGLVVGVAFISAWINNTPVVVVMAPLAIELARRMGLQPSKFLIPVSYAAVLGGLCTLIGTSTNLVVSGMLARQGLPGLGMFELAWVGIPLTLVGAAYLALAGQRLLPSRGMLTSILSDEERREYLTEAFVPAGSRLAGRTLRQGGLTSARGFRVIEVVRDGIAIGFDPESTALRDGDRLILACRPSGIAHARATPGFNFTAETGLETIAAHEGVVFEGAVAPNSALIGRSIGELNFRQRYRVVVLAIHRAGENVREHVDSLPLRNGDLLLMMGTERAIDELRRGEDLILLDRPPLPAYSRHRRIPLVAATIAAVVVAEAGGWLPIEIGSLAGAVFLCLTGCIKPKEAYESIEWPLLFLIFGMLAVGVAMQTTGASSWLAHNVVAGVRTLVTGPAQPLVLLGAVYLVTMVLTEVLSNNAVGALMVPIALSVAQEAGLQAQPFVVAITVAASAAFATPIGYQTNTYVYGIGGYRFGDFVRVGAPLNALCFAVAMLVIPRIWPL